MVFSGVTGYKLRTTLKLTPKMTFVNYLLFYFPKTVTTQKQFCL